MGALLGPPWVAPASAQDYCEGVQTAQPGDGDEVDYFSIVAVDGNHAMVGSLGDDEAETDAGAIYMYELVSGMWTFRQKVLAESPEAGDFFGEGVSLDGVRMVGACPEFSNARGRVQVFAYKPNLPVDERWTHEATLAASDGASGDHFGGTSQLPQAVSISGNIAVIGAAGADLPGKDDAGKAYIFKRDSSNGTWTEVDTNSGVSGTQPLTGGSDAVDGGHFGASVSISGTRMVVGAPGHTVSGHADAGRVYVYDLDSNGVPGSPTTLDLGSGAGNGDGLGRVVSLDRDNLGVGREDNFAVIWRHNGSVWNREGILDTSDGVYFGYTVTVSGNQMIVGDISYDHPNGGGTPIMGVGAAVMYRRSTSTPVEWEEVLVMIPDADHANPGDQFGGAVSLDGDVAFIGAVRDEPPTGATNEGAIYIYRGLPSCD